MMEVEAGTEQEVQLSRRKLMKLEICWPETVKTKTSGKMKHNKLKITAPGTVHGVVLILSSRNWAKF